MMKIKYFLSIVVFSVSAFVINATNFAIRHLPIQKIGGTEFYVYSVSKKESIYAICKKLNLFKDDILKYNPQIVDGLTKGQKLFFPVDDFAIESQSTTNVNLSNTFNHLVKHGETLYGISKLYDIDQNRIIALNPDAVDGVKSGQIIVIPQKNLINNGNHISTKTNNSIIYYTIKEGDTLFSLSNTYHTTIDELLSLNPNISPSHFQSDTVIKIKPNSITDTNSKPIDAKFIEYKTNAYDTFNSISLAYGISETELRQANSGVKKITKNSTIYIPVISKKNILSKSEQNKITKQIYDSINRVQKKSIDIALILPFMLKNKANDKQANLYIDFYKGFLLALDDYSKRIDKKISLTAYDTDDSSNKVEELLKLQSLKKCDIIFAPNDIPQLEMITSYANKNNIILVNSFSLKSEEYNNNSNFFQVNIPAEIMMKNVFSEFDNQFNNSEIIFLSDKGFQDKDIIADLKAHLDETEVTSHIISISQHDYQERINALIQAGGNYVFIPTSSSKTILSKILPELKTIKDNRIDADISMFGYPEWVTYTNYYKDFEHINTLIYTRFYSNINSKEYRNFEAKYHKWFKHKMVESYPTFALLGYDLGKYFIGQINKNGINVTADNKYYTGIQSNFQFNRLNNWSGYVNNALIFVQFTPNNIEKIGK